MRVSAVPWLRVRPAQKIRMISRTLRAILSVLPYVTPSRSPWKLS